MRIFVCSIAIAELDFVTAQVFGNTFINLIFFYHLMSSYLSNQNEDLISDLIVCFLC